MNNIMHFNTQKERMDFIKGKFEEIIPREVKKETKKSKNDILDAENEKKSQKKASKTKKEAKEDGK